MKYIKMKITKIIVGFILFAFATLLNKIFILNDITAFLLYMVPYIYVSSDILKASLKEFKEGNLFNENFLMLIASFGAMILILLPDGPNMFNEGIFVLLFFQIGELFEMIAEGNSENSITDLMNIRPNYANQEVDGEIKKVSPSDIKIDDIIIIKPGESVPLDGIIIDGISHVDTSAITGESKPKSVHYNDNIYSGSLNKEGVLMVKVTKLFEDSTASRIIDIVKNSQENKSKNEKFISKFSKIYTPFVIVLAILIMVIPSFLTNSFIPWIIKGLTFLVISCPCALVISVPLAYFGGIGAASKKGILFKSSSALELFSKINNFVFDKTGTLTLGVFEVTALHPEIISEEELLHLVAHIESISTHPIGTSILNCYKKKKSLNDECIIGGIKEIPGMGLEANINSKKIYVGNEKLMNEHKISYKTCDKIGTKIHVSNESTYLGHIVISDKIKSEGRQIINYLKNKNIKTILLSGDEKKVTNDIGKKLELDEIYSNLLPVDKYNKIVDIKSNKNSIVAYIGDGINDVPALTKADIGITMGKIGSDSALEASDVIFMSDNLGLIKDAFNISNFTKRIAYQNIFISIFIKIFILFLTILGITKMWLAVFADVGVTIIAILNSLRTLK